ncbi:hypothetical protein MSKU15_3072 [Komagataeibacter diospyri]|nr:hypothetical protein MSKU15_3072 [Komagataeibacter diospyri]
MSVPSHGGAGTATRCPPAFGERLRAGEVGLGEAHDDGIIILAPLPRTGLSGTACAVHHVGGIRHVRHASMTDRPYRIGQHFMNGPRRGCRPLRQGLLQAGNSTRHRAACRGKFLRRNELSTCVDKRTVFSIVTLVRRGQTIPILHRSYALLKQ